MDPVVEETPAVVEEARVKRVPIVKRIILIAIPENGPINLVTSTIAKGTRAEEEIEQRTRDIDQTTKFVCLVCPKTSDVKLMATRAYSAIVGKGSPPLKQYVFPENTSLNFLLLLLDMQLRGLNFETLTVAAPPKSTGFEKKSFEQRLSFLSYAKPTFRMTAELTVVPAAAVVKQERMLDLSAVTGKPKPTTSFKKKRFVPKKKD